MSELREATGFDIGDEVAIVGDIGHGIVGTIVANEPHAAQSGLNAFYLPERPYRFRVRFERCPYCGDGPCSGSARTANGRDVERWHAWHTAAQPSYGTIGGLAPVDLIMVLAVES